MFWKRHRHQTFRPRFDHGTAAAFSVADDEPPRAWRPASERQYRIELTDMVKGSYANRNGQRIRQFCVYVDGASKLVTSGDLVDQETYEALLDAGAIHRLQESTPAKLSDSANDNYSTRDESGDADTRHSGIAG